MKITIESTNKIVELVINGVGVPARIWQGVTESGIPVHCFATLTVPEMPPNDPRHAEFERELISWAPPRPTVEAIPLRLVL